MLTHPFNTLDSDNRSSQAMYQHLHSRSALVKRVIHIFLCITAVYLIAGSIYQLQDYIKLQGNSVSAYGEASSRYEKQLLLAKLAANQWESLALKDEAGQRALMYSFANLPNVEGVIVYRQNGEEIAKVPDSFTMRSIARKPDHQIVASAPFAIDEADRGYVVIVVDDLSFEKKKSDRISNQLDTMFSALILGVIGGIYLLRSTLRLREKFRR